jgi:hypothetical protein
MPPVPLIHVNNSEKMETNDKYQKAILIKIVFNLREILKSMSIVLKDFSSFNDELGE